MTLPDLTFVEAFPEPIPNLYQSAHRAQYLYVYLDNVQWWYGLLFAWDITKLTGSNRPVALLDLTKPAIPRVHTPPLNGIKYALTDEELACLH